MKKIKGKKNLCRILKRENIVKFDKAFSTGFKACGGGKCTSHRELLGELLNTSIVFLITPTFSLYWYMNFSTRYTRATLLEVDVKRNSVFLIGTHPLF